MDTDKMSRKYHFDKLYNQSAYPHIISVLLISV